MQDRNYGDLFTLSSSLIGTVTLAVDECKQLASLINRRFQQAFDESPVWPRYLVPSEKRQVAAYVLSGLGGSHHGEINQNYKFIGLNSGRNKADDADLGKSGTKVYQGLGTATTFIYKNSSDAWVVARSIASFGTTSSGTISLETAGTASLTESGSIKKEKLEDVETWTLGTGVSGTPFFDARNLIPYAETDRSTIGDFNRIHRKEAFLNNSSIEYDFYVDLEGANVINIVDSTDNVIYVTYKKQFSTLDPSLSDPVVANDYYGNTAVKVPAEFFNFIAHSVYADFLRIQNKQEEALAEETRAQTYLAQELEKIDIRSNNNTVNQRFSTYVNRQSR